MRIGMILGNGLNMALRGHFPNELHGWDTRNPLQWQQPAEGWSWLGDRFRAAPGATDYERIENATRGDDHHMRQYVCNRLLACFAAYQKAIEALPFESWPWSSWFDRHAEHLDFVVSLNYDLVLETLLKGLGRRYHRIGIRGEDGGTMILKPHGSLDYGFPEGPQKELVEWSETEKVDLVEMTCNYYEALPPDRLCESRYSCDVVLPADYNRIQHYQVISQGYEEVCRRAAGLTHVVVWGVSYWECDQPELDRLLDTVPTAAPVVMANPHPNRDWCARLQRQGRPLACWGSPEPITASPG